MVLKRILDVLDGLVTSQRYSALTVVVVLCEQRPNDGTALRFGGEWAER